MKRHAAVVLMLAGLPWAGINAQQTATATFRVSATVHAACIVSVPALEFGPYTSASSDTKQGSTVIQVTCSPGTTYNIALNKGTTAGASIDQRKMKGPGAVDLNYQLYSDSSHSTIWGDTGSGLVPGSGLGTAVPHTVFGTIAARQAVSAGDYSDTITVTISY